MQGDAARLRPPARRALRSPGIHLVAALQVLAEDRALVVRHEERAWASITFSGARHSLMLRFVGDIAVAAGERFIAALSEHEFAIPRRLVADAAIVAVRHALLPEPSIEVECEVLLLDED